MAEQGMVALTFPDGARREYSKDITGLDIAKGISPSLAKRTVAMALDGKVVDLAQPDRQDARIEFINRAKTRARWNSSVMTPPTFLPRRCRRCGPARRSPSVR